MSGVTNSRKPTPVERDDGRAPHGRLGSDEAEGLVPPGRDQGGGTGAHQRRELHVRQVADVLDVAVELWGDDVLEPGGSLTGPARRSERPARRAARIARSAPFSGVSRPIHTRSSPPTPGPTPSSSTPLRMTRGGIGRVVQSRAFARDTQAYAACGPARATPSSIHGKGGVCRVVTTGAGSTSLKASGRKCRLWLCTTSTSGRASRSTTAPVKAAWSRRKSGSGSWWSSAATSLSARQPTVGHELVGERRVGTRAGIQPDVVTEPTQPAREQRGVRLLPAGIRLDDRVSGRREHGDPHSAHLVLERRR